MDTNLSEQQIKKYESGDTRISGGMIAVLAHAMGAKVWEMYHIVDDIPPHFTTEQIKEHVETIVKGLANELRVPKES